MSTDLGSLIYTLMLNDAGFEGQAVAAAGSFKAIGGAATKSAEEVSLAQDKQIASMGKTKAASEELHTTTGSVGSGMNSMALGAAAVAVGIGIVADKTVKAAGDFQEQLTGLVTGAGENEKNIGLVSKGLLDMASQTGTTTKQLTDGMFMIESAGYHGADGLNVLQAAAEGAKVGQADLGTVADATTTIMKDYAGTLPTNAVNELIATVANGKTHMADLSSSLSQVLPTASAAKVGLNDVMGAMATMTGEGVPAANAATYLRQTIIGLTAPGTAAKKALQDVGLSSEEVSKQMQISLPSTLKMITDAVGKKFPEGSSQYVEAIKSISGGSKTMQGMLDLTGGHMKDFQGNVESVGGAVKEGGNKIMGWNEVQKDFSFKMAQAKASIDTAGIALGTALMPALTIATKAAADFLKPIAEWVMKNQSLAAGIMIAVGVIAALVVSITLIAKAVEMTKAAWDIAKGAMEIGGSVIKWIAQIAVYVGTHIAGAASVAMAWIAANIAMTAGIALIIIVVVAAVALIITHWKQISTFFTELWNNVVNGVKTFVGDVVQIFHTLVDFFTGGDITLTKDHLSKPFIEWVKFLNGLRDNVVTIFQNVVGFFVTVGKDIANVFNGVVNFFKQWGMTILAVAFWWIAIPVGLIIQHWKPIHAFFQSVWEGIKAVFAPVVSFFQGVWDGVVAVFKAVVGFYVGLFTAEVKGVMLVWGAVVGFFQGVWDGIVSIFNAVVGFYVGIYTAAWHGIVAVWNAVVGWFGGVWNGIVTIFSPVIGWFGNVFQQAWNNIKNVFSSVGSFFGGVWNTIVSIFGSVGSAVGNAIGNAFRGVMNSVVGQAVGIINGFIGTINAAIGAINAIPGVHLGSLPKLGVPHFATGTNNYPGGWGIMNEMGGELVKLPNGSQIIPADKTSKMMGGNTTYNFGQGSVVLSTAEAVGAFFNIGNRNTQLEGLGISPLAGTTRV